MRPLSYSALSSVSSCSAFDLAGFNCFRSSGELSTAFIAREGRVVVAVVAA